MSAKVLVGKFAWTYTLPVEDKHIVQKLREMGVKDEFEFFSDSKLPKDVLQGYITRWYNVEEDKHYTFITHAEYEEDPFMGRFIACKELIHVLDPVSARVRSEDELCDLIEKIVLPLHMQEILTDSMLTDRVAEVYAMAVLFPFNARNRMIEKYRGGKLSLTQIADVARLPLPYVKVVMSDAWLGIYKRLLPGEQKG